MRRPQPKTISVAEAAWLYFAIKSERAAFAALKRGDLIAIKIGRRWRVPVAQMEMKIQKLADTA
jgi:hypothetical protein